MKKVLALMAGLLLMSSPAFAILHADFADGKITASGSPDTTSVTTFDINGPAPWLYLLLPTNSTTGRNSSVTANWFYGTEIAARFSTNDAGTTDTQSAFWESPSVGTWDTFKEVGDWHINANYLWVIPGSGASNDFKSQNDKVLNFSVTPEPASMALFGLGAGALALTRRRKRAQA